LVATVAVDQAGSDNQAVNQNDNQVIAQEGAPEGQRNERRSRDRYGRDRRERNGDRPERAERTTEQSADITASDNIRAEPAAAPAFVATAPTVAPVAAVAVSAPARAPAPVPAHAVAVAVASMPTVTSYALPVADLAQVATTSGLQWVGSDTAKIAAAQASIAAELANAPVHVPRERPPAVVVEAASLVLVETKRDLRDMQLPFEAPSAS
jgi:ribonuclease E